MFPRKWRCLSSVDTHWGHNFRRPTCQSGFLHGGALFAVNPTETSSIPVRLTTSRVNTVSNLQAVNVQTQAQYRTGPPTPLG